MKIFGWCEPLGEQKITAKGSIISAIYQFPTIPKCACYDDACPLLHSHLFGMSLSIRFSRSCLTALTAATVLLGQITTVHAGAADPRVGEILKEANLKFNVDNDGDYAVVIGLPNNRSQLVIITSSVQNINGLELREVYSPGYQNGQVDADFPAPVMFKLMKESNRNKIGSWEVMKINGKSTAIFNAKVPTNIDGKSLTDIVKIVAIRSDTVEAEVMQKDDW
jgi:hypothetical protein